MLLGFQGFFRVFEFPSKQPQSLDWVCSYPYPELLKIHGDKEEEDLNLQDTQFQGLRSHFSSWDIPAVLGFRFLLLIDTVTLHSQKLRIAMLRYESSGVVELVY